MARPEDLTVDYKKLLRMTVHDRISMAKSPMGQSYLASLSPTQYAQLFPSYYSKMVPTYSAVQAATTKGGKGGGAGAYPTSAVSAASSIPSGPAATTGPTPSSAVKPGWLARFENEVLKKTGPVGAANVKRAPGGIDRSKFHNEMRDPQVRELFYTMMDAEVGSMNKASHVAFAETVFNRAQYEGKTLKQILSNRDYYQPYKDGGYKKAQNRMNDQLRQNYSSVIDEVGIGGSDTTNGASHNASGSVAKNAVKEYDAVPETLMNIGGETYYSKTFEQKQRKNLPRITQDIPKLSKEATGVQKQAAPEDDAAETGLGPKGRAADQTTLSEANKRRPGYMAGRIRVGEGEGAFVAAAGSGGRSEQFPSVPYGVQKLGPLEAPGPNLSGTFSRTRGQGRTKIVNISDMYDPTVGRNRTEIQIHPAISPRDVNGDDVKDLISKGCIAVDPSQYDAFMSAYQKYYEENNGQVWFVNVPNPDGSHEWVITNRKPEGNVYTPQQAIDSQKKTGEPIPQIALPPGLNQGIVNHFKNLGPEDQMDFVKKLESYGEGGIQKINEYYDQHIANLPAGEREKIEKGIVEAVKTEGAPTSFSNKEEEKEYYDNLLVRAEKIGGVEIDSNIKGRGWCGKGTRGLTGALLNEKYFNQGLGAGGDSRAASLSGNNRYFQDSGFYNEKVPVSTEQVKNKEYLDSLPIGTVISSQGGKDGDGHVQTKIGPNQWVSDYRQGNKVLPGYYNYVVHTPNQAGINKLDPRIASDSATLTWAKNQGYTLSNAQQNQVKVEQESALPDDVMPEPTLGPTSATPTAPAAPQPAPTPTASVATPTAPAPAPTSTAPTQEQIASQFTDADKAELAKTPGGMPAYEFWKRKEQEYIARNAAPTATPAPQAEQAPPAPEASATPAPEQAAPAPEQTAQPAEEQPKAMSTGGLVNVPPGEDIAGVNMKTGKTEFYANSREGVTQLKIDPATLVNEKKQSQAIQTAIETYDETKRQPNKPVATMASTMAPIEGAKYISANMTDVHKGSVSEIRHLSQTKADPYRNGTGFNV